MVLAKTERRFNCKGTFVSASVSVMVSFPLLLRRGCWIGGSSEVVLMVLVESAGEAELRRRWWRWLRPRR